jgi:trans-2-enoyl-CoA reductase
MASNDPKYWEQHFRDATKHAEEEVRRVVTYINDEVVPDIRRNGSEALRLAAAELQKLAKRMDDRRAAASGETPPPPNPGQDKPQP